MSTALVTGSTGFVGTNLVEHLVGGGWDVIALHRDQSDIRRLQALGVERVVADIRDIESLRSAVPGSLDAIFHVAGDTRLWEASEADQLRINVKGTRNMVRVALEHKARRLVFTSSAVAFGLHSGRVTEQTPVRAAGSAINYVRSKAMAEREIRKGIRRGLDAVILNPANILGPYDRANWSKLFQLIQQRRLFGVPDGGGSFCDAGQVAAAHVAAAERGGLGQNYLLGGVDLAYVRLVRLAARRLGRRVLPRPIPVRVMRGYARAEEAMARLFGRPPDMTRDTVTLLASNLYCSAEKAKRELGFEPVDIETMMDRCI